MNNFISKEKLNEALHNLNPDANHYFSNISANEELKHKIIQKAYFEKRKPQANILKRLLHNTKIVSAFGAAIVVLIVFLSTNSLSNLSVQNKTSDPPAFINIPASGSDNAAKESTATFSAMSGSLTISEGTEVKYNPIWINDVNSIQFVQYNNQVYRLLDIQVNDTSILSDSAFATVQKSSATPQSTSDTISNILAIGSELHYVSNMGTDIIAANLNGGIMFFQKYENSQGSVAFIPDTAVSLIQSVYIDGLGEILNKQKAISFINNILSTSKKIDFTSDLDRFMLIHFDNGITMQFLVTDNAIKGSDTYQVGNLFTTFMEYMD